jgi:dihydrofolate reductase
MARIVGYIAMSMDGFIAREDGNLDWLLKHGSGDGTDGVDTGYADFIKEIGTVVMGRATYDWLVENSKTWPYPNQRSYVVTSRPLPDPMTKLELRTDIDALVAELRAITDGEVWMLGGGQLQMAFMERDALDAIDIFIAPEIIGGGIPLFPPTGLRKSARLVSAAAIGGTFVRLRYDLTA